MSIYRIYALIHGETIPEGEIFGCKIKKMDFEEQKKRKFSPIRAVFSNDIDQKFEKTYVTVLPYKDSIKMKSEYVVSYDIEDDNPNAALGGAVKEIDKLCRCLSIACLEDVKKKFNKEYVGFEPYIYQVNKIYKLNPIGDEISINFQLKSGYIYLPNRPEFDQWRDSETQRFLEEIYHFNDPTLQRALKYLYTSSIGHLLKSDPEKIALDHMKSIELIIDKLSSKNNFKDRVEEAGVKISLSPKEKESILRFWDERSNFGDVAHAVLLDNSENYMNQFPLPSGVQYSGGSFDGIAPNVIIKYFKYIKDTFTIDIHEINDKTSNNIKNDSFGKVITLFPFNVSDQNHLCFHTTEKDKNTLKVKIKKIFIKQYKIPENYNIEVSCVQNKNKYIKRRIFELKICTKI